MSCDMHLYKNILYIYTHANIHFCCDLLIVYVLDNKCVVLLHISLFQYCLLLSSYRCFYSTENESCSTGSDPGFLERGGGPYV